MKIFSRKKINKLNPRKIDTKLKSLENRCTYGSTASRGKGACYCISNKDAKECQKYFKCISRKRLEDMELCEKKIQRGGAPCKKPRQIRNPKTSRCKLCEHFTIGELRLIASGLNVSPSGVAPEVCDRILKASKLKPAHITPNDKYEKAKKQIKDTEIVFYRVTPKYITISSAHLRAKLSKAELEKFKKEFNPPHFEWRWRVVRSKQSELDKFFRKLGFKIEMEPELMVPKRALQTLIKGEY